MQQELGEYIAQKRKGAGMTQEDLARILERLSVPRAASTIANWEAGRGSIPIEALDALAQALNEPSPAKLYELAGILDKIPGGRIIAMLHNASPEDIHRVERLIKAYLDN